MSHVLRIPNPGSDIDIMARIFRELYRDLSDHSTFILDDISRAMINRNNVTSQGALGPKALIRSTRPDRSRDPLYNQSKMYAEVYRVLGLISSVESALLFRFSHLGQHLGVATDPAVLLKECLLGIAYPNRVVEVKGNNQVRLFVCILRCMTALDGKISRDEIILGPMSITNDRDEKEFQDLVQRLKQLRSTQGGIERAIEGLSQKAGISPNTMHNYTRIPIGALLWTGWAVKEEGYFHLTELGRAILKTVGLARGIRIDDFDNLQPQFRAPLVRVSFYEMLGRAGFDLAPVRSILETDRKTLAVGGFNPEQPILFSPFQQLGNEDLSGAFGETIPRTSLRPTSISASPSEIRSTLVSRIVLRQNNAVSPTPGTDSEKVLQTLQEAVKACGNDRDKVIDALHRKYETSARDEFYPLVTALFNIAGFHCELTRTGVNSARADARIVLKDDTIPIEIKSPSEESEISVKAVRQALENKIVFLSRKMFPCDAKTSTLVVGFKSPNARSEVNDLIKDIKKCFDVSVGIFDFRNLLLMTLSKLNKGLTMDADKLKTVEGLVLVEDP